MKGYEERRQRELAVRQPKAGQVWTSPSGIKLVLIPAGTFLMGSEKKYNATPHQVTVSKPFYMGKYLVTQREWAIIIGNNPSNFKGDSRPVENVSWNDCQEFIRRLNAYEKVNKYRLPTESEWEYACRAGSKSKYCFGDSEHILQQYAWFDENSEGKTHPVGQLNPNDWGLYDMHGNVWEWCHDRYGDYPTKAVIDPSGAGSSYLRVLRSGSRGGPARTCTAAIRDRTHPDFRNGDLGFRLVRLL